MTPKITILAALCALFVAAPAVQAQPDNSDSRAYHHHRHYARHYHRRCGLIRRGEYGVFGHYHNRLTIGCQ